MARAIKKSKTYHLLDNFFLFSLTALACSLFCSSPFWFPSLCSSLKAFLFVFLPKVGLVLLSPQALFIVGNLIVIILIGESKFFASSESSPANDVYYEEYISKSTSVRHSSTLEENKEIRQREKICFEGNVDKTCEDRHYRENKKSWVEEEKEEEEEEEEEKEEEEEEEVENGKDDYAFPAEELSKRADDFIARVNRQRRLEATRLISSGD